MHKPNRIVNGAIALSLSTITVPFLLPMAAKADGYYQGSNGEILENTVCSFITGNNVNIRSGPGTQYRRLVKLNRGDGVRAAYREGNWVKIEARVYGYTPNETFESLDGWVYNQYINGCSEDQFDRWRD